MLFDASHGKGVRMDAMRLYPFIETAYESNELCTVGITVAGGLNSQVVREDLPQLVQDYPDLSWDAEGQLHPVNRDNKRPLDMPIVMDYFDASVEVLRSV